MTEVTGEKITWQMQVCRGEGRTDLCTKKDKLPQKKEVRSRLAVEVEGKGRDAV